MYNVSQQFHFVFKIIPIIHAKGHQIYNHIQFICLVNQGQYQTWLAETTRRGSAGQPGT